MPRMSFSPATSGSRRWRKVSSMRRTGSSGPVDAAMPAVCTDAVHAAERILLKRVTTLANSTRHDHVCKSPSGHRIGFRRTVDDVRTITHIPSERGDRNVVAVEIEIRLQSRRRRPRNRGAAPCRRLARDRLFVSTPPVGLCSELMRLLCAFDTGLRVHRDPSASCASRAAESHETFPGDNSRTTRTPDTRVRNK